MTALHHVEPGEWRRSIERALGAGERFAGAWARAQDGGLSWRALIVSAHGGPGDLDRGDGRSR